MRSGGAQATWQGWGLRRAKSLLGPQGLSNLPGPVWELRDTLVSEAEASANIAHPASRGGASRSRLPCGSAYNWGPSRGMRRTQPSSTSLLCTAGRLAQECPRGGSRSPREKGKTDHMLPSSCSYQWYWWPIDQKRQWPSPESALEDSFKEGDVKR